MNDIKEPSFYGGASLLLSALGVVVGLWIFVDSRTSVTHLEAVCVVDAANAFAAERGAENYRVHFPTDGRTAVGFGLLPTTKMRGVGKFNYTSFALQKQLGAGTRESGGTEFGGNPVSGTLHHEWTPRVPIWSVGSLPRRVVLKPRHGDRVVVQYKFEIDVSALPTPVFVLGEFLSPTWEMGTYEWSPSTVISEFPILLLGEESRDEYAAHWLVRKAAVGREQFKIAIIISGVLLAIGLFDWKRTGLSIKDYLNSWPRSEDL